MDITTTATVRPEILARTFASFEKYLFGNLKDHRLVVNIDFIGELDRIGEMSDVVSEKFDKYLLFTRNSPNFAKAFLTVWKHAQSKYVFHLEDDWEMLRTVNLQMMTAIMDQEPDLALLRLPVWDCGISCKQWNKTFPWNGRYFQCPEELKTGVGFSGNPSLIRKEFIDEALPLLHDRSCPEKQMKGTSHKMIQFLKKWEYGVFSEPGFSSAVADIGRQWRMERGLIKKGSIGFTTWTSKNT